MKTYWWFPVYGLIRTWWLCRTRYDHTVSWKRYRDDLGDAVKLNVGLLVMGGLILFVWFTG